MSVALEEEKLELQERIISYAKSVINDEVFIREEDGKAITGAMGKKFKQACDRFFKDLKDERYYMDWQEVLRFNRWASMFKHTKGVLAREHIKLTDWQLFLVANIFGMKQKKNGFRKYREAYIQIAKKNTKSQLLSMMVSYVAFLSDQAEEVYISCWTRDQSNLVYNEALAQINQVNMLEDRYSDSYQMIKVYNNNSTIRALSREARKSADGQNPSFAVLDEYKDNVTSELRDTQKNGMVARAEPMLVIITTAGFDLNVPCFNDYEYYTDILDPEVDVENDEVFIAICEIDKGDDIKDEKNWVKANPILVTYETGLESLRSELKLALDQPERMRAFMTKHMNVWVDQKEDGYMSMEKWNKQEVDEDFAKAFMEGANMYYGFDLSSTIDLTSLGWVAVKDGKFLIGQHSYTPEDMFREKISQDKVRYDVFQDRGELTVTEGSVVDYNYIKDDLIAMAREHGVKQVGFDVWNATHLATELANEGLEMVEVKQTITRLSEATKSFRENIYNGKIYHTGDNLLRWAMNNAIVQEDTNENIKINKSKSKDRVDPVDAIMNAYSLAMFDNQTVDLNSTILADDWSF